nr:MAG TPA: hypothetical protein [Caudoviricetes sp.]
MSDFITSNTFCSPYIDTLDFEKIILDYQNNDLNSILNKFETKLFDNKQFYINKYYVPDERHYSEPQIYLYTCFVKVIFDDIYTHNKELWKEIKSTLKIAYKPFSESIQTQKVHFICARHFFYKYLLTYEEINGKRNLSILIDNLIAILTVHLENFDREVELKFIKKGKVKSNNQEFVKYKLKSQFKKNIDL